MGKGEMQDPLHEGRERDLTPEEKEEKRLDSLAAVCRMEAPVLYANNNADAFAFLMAVYRAVADRQHDPRFAGRTMPPRFEFQVKDNGVLPRDHVVVIDKGRGDPLLQFKDYFGLKPDFAIHPGNDWPLLFFPKHLLDL